MNPTALDRAYEAMGKYNEKMYMPIIKRIYGNLLKTSSKFATIDFYGVDYMLELKSRDCFSFDYKDTMFGYNKVVDAIETLDHYKDHMPHYKVYFAFAFKSNTHGLHRTCFVMDTARTRHQPEEQQERRDRMASIRCPFEDACQFWGAL